MSAGFTRAGNGFSWSLRTLAFSLIAASSLFAFSACGSADEPEEKEEETAFEMGEPIQDSTLAVIVSSDDGSDTLTTSEFHEQIQMIFQRYPEVEGNVEQAREVRRTVVEQFALSHALKGEVNEQGLAADTGKVEQQIRDLKERFGSEEAFQQALEEQNLTEARFRETVREQLNQQTWQEKVLETAPEPTEEELESFREEQAEQVRVQHILFFSPQPDSAVEHRAEAVLDTAKAGTVPFDELARRHSDDGTAAQGGDLDYFSRGEMVEPFADAAFALSDSGDVADEVVRTQFGYHIIRFTGRRTGDKMAAEQAKEMMMRTRRQDVVMEAVDRLRGEVTVRLNPEIVDADLNVREEE